MLGPDSLQGRWQLAFSTEAPYRSSPFFAAFRQLTGDVPSLVPTLSEDDTLAGSIFAVTDGIPVKQEGVIVQDITPDSLVSRVTIEISLFDAIIPRMRSVMTTTSTVISTERVGRRIETRLCVESTQVRDSTLEEVLPFVPIGDVTFPTAEVFGRVRRGCEYVTMTTVYLSDLVRISTFDNENFAVWARCAEDGKDFTGTRTLMPTEPAGWSWIDEATE